MNDVCPKCRKPLKPGVIRPHPIRVNLAVHSFECANCGAVKTKVLFQAPSAVADQSLTAVKPAAGEHKSAALGRLSPQKGAGAAPGNPELVARQANIQADMRLDQAARAA